MYFYGVLSPLFQISFLQLLSETNPAMLLKLDCAFISEDDVSKVFLRLELFIAPNKSLPLVQLRINEMN